MIVGTVLLVGGALLGALGGRRARAATAAGVQALFIECHPDPANAASDGATQQPLDAVPGLLRHIAAIHGASIAGQPS